MLPILRRITFWLRKPSPVRTQTTVTTSTQTSGECLSCTMTYRKHSPPNHEFVWNLFIWGANTDGLLEGWGCETMSQHNPSSSPGLFDILLVQTPAIFDGKEPMSFGDSHHFFGGSNGAKSPCSVDWSGHIHISLLWHLYSPTLSFQRAKYLLCNLFPQNIDTFRESQLQHWIHWPGAFSESPKKPPAPKVL